MPEPTDRKLRGAWYTPPDLVEQVVAAAVTPAFATSCAAAGADVRIVDPACGDGRFLVAAAAQLARFGCRVHAVGVDIDSSAADVARTALTDAQVADFEVICADALTLDWRGASFDLVIGNPPFLSQMAAATTRGGASGRGGGPYADAAVEFVALGAELVAQGGRMAYVLPQSVLAARDARPTRLAVDTHADIVWSSWTGAKDFDAAVHTCALVFQFGAPSARAAGSWAHVVTERTGVPDVPADLDDQGAGLLGDRCWLNANFRDEYYGMIPSVGDHADGPRLVTSGLIDPGRSLWGSRPIRFAKQRFDAPRIDLDALDDKMQRWAQRRLVPKVLVANQTKVIEAVADPVGDMLPGVPVVAAYPTTDDAAATAWEIAAVLTSPVASAWAWHRNAGTGLSADSIRLGPVLLAELPWPGGDLAAAVRALQHHDVRGCGRAVQRSFGIADEAMFDWWEARLARIEARQPPKVTDSPHR